MFARPAPRPAAPAKTVFDPLTQQLDRARDVQNTVDQNADATRKAVDVARARRLLSLVRAPSVAMSPLDGLIRAWRWSIRKILGSGSTSSSSRTAQRRPSRRARGRSAMCSSTKATRISRFSTMRAPRSACPGRSGPASRSRASRRYGEGDGTCARRATWCSWSRRRKPTPQSTSI